MSSASSSHFRRTISFRLAGWYSVFFVLSVVLLFAVAYMLVFSSLRHRDRESIHHELNELAAQYRVGGVPAIRQFLMGEETLGTPEPFLIRIVGPGDAVLFLWKADQWTRFEGAPPTGGTAVAPALSLLGHATTGLELASLRLPDGASLEVALTTDDRDDVLRRFRATMAAVALPVIALAVAGGTFLASRVLRPLRGIVETVTAIQAGSTNARVPTRHTGDELDELSTLFNRMLDNIAALIGGMRGTLDNVAHDLRTPMTRIRMNAELALRSNEDLPTCRQVLAECVEEADQLLTMLNTLMDISEAEHGALRLDLELVDIAAVVGDAVDLYRYVAEAHRVEVLVRAPRELRVAADRNRMRQVFANLLDNAIKYTSAGGRITVQVYQEQQSVVIEVQDTGIGIGPDEIPKVWERLYRGVHSRPYRGLGLGLSLVRAIVQTHGGRVEVSSTVGLGSRFRVLLPLPSPIVPHG